MSFEEMWGEREGNAIMSVHLNVLLVAELERRRRAWGLKTKGEVLEVMFGWMVKDSD